MRDLIVIPLTEVGGVRFGMMREEVRGIFGAAEEFRKSPIAKTTTDDFGFCHVYYDADGKCEAVEIFDDTQVTIGGKVVFPGSVGAIKRIVGDLKKDDSGYISRSQSIGIYAPDRNPEAILFGRAGYYD